MSKFAFQYQGVDETYNGKYVQNDSFNCSWTTDPSKALVYDTYEEARKHHRDNQYGSWMKIVDVDVQPSTFEDYDRAMEVV